MLVYNALITLLAVGITLGGMEKPQMQKILDIGFSVYIINMTFAIIQKIGQKVSRREIEKVLGLRKDISLDELEEIEKKEKGGRSL